MLRDLRAMQKKPQHVTLPLHLPIVNACRPEYLQWYTQSLTLSCLGASSLVNVSVVRFGILAGGGLKSYSWTDPPSVEAFRGSCPRGSAAPSAPLAPELSLP